MRTITVCLLAVTAACVASETPDGAPFRVQVLDVTDIDRSRETVAYALVERELVHVDDFDQLDGPYLRMSRGGQMVARDVAGEVVTDGEFSAGKSPGLRYVVEDGVVVPRDYPTLAMLSSYYQFEVVFDSLERVVGVTPDALIAETGGFEVFFEPAFRLESDDLDATVVMKLNAFYLNGARQFGLAQRSSLETVPLAGNPMVIAHEFGHAMFEYTFHGGEAPACDEDAKDTNATDPMFPGRFSHEYALSGMNEGFSDILSFAVHGTTNVLAGSGVIDNGERSLTRSEYRFDDGIEDCEGAFYCVGTLFARSLYDAYVGLGYDPADAEQRGAFSREVIAAMSATRASLASRGELPLPEADVAKCERNEELRPEYDGQVAGAFLAAFAENLPPPTRAAFCVEAIASFGERGFPVAMRGPCEGDE